MITAGRLRECREGGGIVELFRQLGYPVDPIEVDMEGWRRAGIEIAWNGAASLQIVARMRRFDLFLLRGEADHESIARFLRSYAGYNVITKSAIIYESNKLSALSIYDLSDRHDLRRLDIDLESVSSHALDRLNLLDLSSADAVSIPRLFDRAFDRESVTRRFFDRFRSAVDEVAEALAKECPDESEESGRGEALRILSRLLFLSFIQKKGWLSGERRFLVDRLELSLRRGDEFFSSVVKPLFFGCLNTPLRDRDEAARRLGSIPYLNGGLFEPSPFERAHTALRLPNELMARVLEELFERFDFSIDERDSAGLHVDPQMLGKVFESLMAADERAASGSFYTPKEIVDALTSRAITEWLADGDAALREALSKSDASLDCAVARGLLSRLDSITVLDPACGSGAFLLSALSVIERLTETLSAAAGVKVEPNLRQRIVERSLFGVDLKIEAVRLCELRLWLAIVSTSEAAIEEVPPLPNLDRNILQGNSLLSPTDFLGDGRGDVYREWMVAIRAQSDLIERYQHGSSVERPALARLMRENDRRIAADLLAHAIERDEDELHAAAMPQRDLFGRSRMGDAERCRELQQRIAATRSALGRVDDGMLDFFSFDIHFAPVMARGGFDVIVGNPPWVRNSRIDARTKRMVADRYVFFRAGADRAAFHQPDLALVFFERSLSLARPRGVVAMLMPAKVLNAGYAARFRAGIDALSIVDLTDWSAERRRHFEADTFPLGVTVAKRAGAANVVSITSDNGTFFVPQSSLDAGDSRGEWSLAPPEVTAIVRRLRHDQAPLEEILGRRPLMGVKTGDNSRFFLEATRIRHGSLQTTDGVEVPLAAVCRCARGRDLRRWAVNASQWMLWPPQGGWRERPEWLERLAAVRGVDPASFRLSYVRPEHVGIKVAWKDVSRGIAAAVLPDVVTIDGHAFPLIPNQTLYSIDATSLDEAYVIAAILNSTVFEAQVLSIAERAKDAHFRYFGRTIARIAFPRIETGSTVWEVLVRLSRRAHHGAEASEEIDRVVAALYGVTARELAKLRSYVDRALARSAR